MRISINKKNIAIVFILVFKINFAQPGGNDFKFNIKDTLNNGDASLFSSDVLISTIQSDGKMLMGGWFNEYNGKASNYFIRLKKDGQIDKKFNIGEGFNNSVKAIDVQSDGKIIVGGNFTKFNGINIKYLVRLNADGTLDQSFNSNIGFNDFITSVSVQSDGKIIVVGEFTSFNGNSINRIIRLNSDGSLDLNFNVGSGFNYGVYEAKIKSDGKILVVGTFTSYNGVSRNNVVQLNTDGTIDMNFNPGIGFNDHTLACAIQGDGKILIGGLFTSFNGSQRNRLARLNANGSLDTSFNVGSAFNDAVRDIVISSDGKIFAVGDFTEYKGTNYNRIISLNSNGSVNSTFNVGTGLSESARTIFIQSDGKVGVGGSFYEYNQIEANYFVRLNSNGSKDDLFNLGSGFNEVVSQIKELPDGKILVVGGFTKFNNIDANYLIKLNHDGTIDQSFNLLSEIDNSISTLLVLPDNKIIIVGGFTKINGKVRNGIARLNSDGTLDLGFDPGSGFNDFVSAIYLQSDGKILVGGWFSSYNGTSRKGIVRINSDGSIDVSFNPGTGISTGSVASIGVLSNNVIVLGGSFSTFNGVSASNIICLNQDGTINSSFNSGSGFSAPVSRILIDPNDKILVGGDFTSYKGSSIYYFAVLNSNGSIDPSFISGAGFFGGGVYAIAIDGYGKYVLAGDFNKYNGDQYGRIIRLNNSGSVDTIFKTQLGFDEAIYALHIQNDDNILVGGAFNAFNLVNRNRIARITTCNAPLNTVNKNWKTLTANEVDASYQWLDCDNNLLPIAGANNQSFTVTKSGNYAVEITKNGCTIVSNCVLVNLTSLDNEMLNEVTIHPNPSSGVFFFNSKHLDMLYEVYDSFGRLVEQGCLKQENQEINLNSLVEGVYVIKFGSKSYKLIKSKF